jgi:hypothetical protein
LNYNGQSKVKIKAPGSAGLGTVVHTPNNHGDICMTVFDINSFAHGAVVKKSGSYTVFDDPNASNSTRADGLNNKLIVVGRYSPSDATNHGFKAVPQ